MLLHPVNLTVGGVPSFTKDQNPASTLSPGRIPLLTAQRCRWLLCSPSTSTDTNHVRSVAPPPPSNLSRGVIDFSAKAPLETNQRNDAKRRFYRIVEHFGTGGAIDSVPPQYEPPRLVRYTYEYALSEESRDNLLRAFFQALALSLTGQDNDDDLGDLEDLRSLFFGFASYLLDNFFLPSNTSGPFVLSFCLY